jgi:hypothetical protein
MLKMIVIKFSTSWEKEVILATGKMTKFKNNIGPSENLSSIENCIDSAPENSNLMTDESSDVTLEGQYEQL